MLQVNIYESLTSKMPKKIKDLVLSNKAKFFKTDRDFIVKNNIQQFSHLPGDWNFRSESDRVFWLDKKIFFWEGEFKQPLKVKSDWDNNIHEIII